MQEAGEKHLSLTQPFPINHFATITLQCLQLLEVVDGLRRIIEDVGSISINVFEQRDDG